MPPSILGHDHDLLDGEDGARANLVVPDPGRVGLGAAFQIESLAQNQPQPELASMLPQEHGLDPVAGFNPRRVSRAAATGGRLVVVDRELSPGRLIAVAHGW